MELSEKIEYRITHFVYNPLWDSIFAEAPYQFWADSDQGVWEETEKIRI